MGHRIVVNKTNGSTLDKTNPIHDWVPFCRHTIYFLLTFRLIPPAFTVGPDVRTAPEAFSFPSPRVDASPSDPVFDEASSLSTTSCTTTAFWPCGPVLDTAGTDVLPGSFWMRDLTRARNHVLPMVGRVAVEASMRCFSPVGSSFVIGEND